MKINPLVYLVIAVVVLGGLFFLFKPKTSPVTTQPNLAATQTTPNTFEIVIQGMKIVSGPQTIKVKQGEDVTIKITSNEAEEFHVHAYDNGAKLEPGKQASLTFNAKLSGRFPFELENSKTEIGVLEVQPQ